MQEYMRLEEDLQKWTGCNYVASCSSGTAALHIALEALRLKNAGVSEVICPNYTMIACPRAISLSGMKPVFVDCQKDTLNINPEYIEQALSPNTAAIMAVHIYGRMCNMTVIHEIADKYGIPVIEDMAEAHGLYPHPNTYAACWSFYKNKIVNGEEGGCIGFREEKYLKEARELRCIGFTDEHNYYHTPRGNNYRMSNTHATLIRESIKQFKNNLSYRRVIENSYDVLCPPEWRLPFRASPWVYDLRVSGLGREMMNKLVTALKVSSIEARHGFVSCGLQQEYRDNNKCRIVGNRQSDKATEEVFSLPLGLNNSSSYTAIAAFRVIKNLLKYW